MWRRGATVALLLVAGVVAGLLWRDGSPDARPSQDKPVDVAVATSRQVVLPRVLEASGHVVPLDSVEMRTLIDGVVRRMGFSEGGMVSAGQVLFELEADEIKAELAHARADLVRLAAEIDDAEANLERGRNLLESAYISSSSLDALVARHKSLHAQMQAATAIVQGAEARLEHATIRAPLDARAGMTAVRQGARVRPADADPLVVLHRVDPIGIEFTLPERALPAIIEAPAGAPVRLQAVTEAGDTVEGQLAVLDNAIDRATGTIRLRAQLDNARELLWPGAFVRVRLSLEAQAPSVVVPPHAVVEGPEGAFVYRLREDGTVSAQPLRVLRVQDGLAVVEGLAAGERIVTEGTRMLRDGAAVRVRTPPEQDASPDASADAPAP